MIRTWSIIDFVLVMLGGFLGTAVFAVIGIVAASDEYFILLALAGQYAGHLFVLWLLNRSKPEGSLGFEVRGRDAGYLIAGLGLQFGLSLLFLPLVLYLFPEGGPAQEVGSTISELESSGARISSLLISVVLAPITEELAFRGVLIQTMINRSRRFIIVVSALVFSLFHVLGLATDNFGPAAAVVLPQLFIVGMILAWVTLRSERLGPAIFLHGGFNLLAAIVLLLPPEVLNAG
ncbi:MAG: CPBP family intramembrane metalloprotease [Actinobacteria bacterium]|nr:MAG: CPBP family intramembrane metalloprotease [Actinomycetota bacterium]